MEFHPDQEPMPPEGRDTHVQVMEFLTCFLKVVRFLKLYPSMHPFISRAFEDLRVCRRNTRASRLDLGFDAQTGSVLVDGIEAFRSPNSLHSLQTYLAEKRIEGFAISRETEFSELRDLAVLLSRPREEVLENNALKPIHVISLKGIRLVRSWIPASGDANDSLGPGSGARSRLSRILDRALPDGISSSNAPDNKVVGFLLEPQEDAAGAGPEFDIGSSLHDQPDFLAQGVAQAVNQILMGAENPSTQELLSAFSYCLEKLVTALLDKEGGGYRNTETAMRRILAPFDREFTREMLPEGPDGQVKLDRLFHRFSSSLKLRVLKEELVDEALDHGTFRSMLDTFTSSEEEEDDLLNALTRSISEDRRFETSFDRVSRVIGLGPRTQRRRGVVLALEPHPDEGHRLRLRLQHEDLEIHLLTDVEKLLGEVERLNPDVILMNPRLRGIQGVQLISRLRRSSNRTRPVPLILYSEDDTFQHDFEVVAYPDHHYILKKEGDAEVIRCINQILKASTSFDTRAPAVSRGGYRPTRNIANQHFFVANFEILTFHQSASLENMIFFDIIPLDDFRTGILLAEGFRKGVADEQVCTDIRKQMRALLASSASPRKLISDLNALFYEKFRGKPLITAQALVLDSHLGSLTSCLAGGMKPLRLSATGAVEEIELPSGIVLGFSRSQVFEASLRERRLPVAAGDTVLIPSYSLATALGNGQETQALPEIRHEVARAFLENPDSSSPLLKAQDRLAARISGKATVPMDRAAIWIRCLQEKQASTGQTSVQSDLLGKILSNPN